MRFGATLLAAAAPAVLVTLVVAAPAAACMCAEPPPPARALEKAAAVFAGRVTAVEDAARETGVGKLPRKLATVELSAVWKGVEEGASVVVWTGIGGGDCGYPFEVGTEVLVYALASDDGSLSTNSCLRTKRFEDAAGAGEVEALGEPVRRPAPPSTPPAPPGSR